MNKTSITILITLLVSSILYLVLFEAIKENWQNHFKEQYRQSYERGFHNAAYSAFDGKPAYVPAIDTIYSGLFNGIYIDSGYVDTRTGEFTVIFGLGRDVNFDSIK